MQIVTSLLLEELQKERDLLDRTATVAEVMDVDEDPSTQSVLGSSSTHQQVRCSRPTRGTLGPYIIAKKKVPRSRDALNLCGGGPVARVRQGGRLAHLILTRASVCRRGRWVHPWASWS